jgi:anti-sigma regulatory factor (Ser/Thr protein kinase)
MKIHIPNSVWLGNIDPFLRSFDTSNSNKLEISAHEQWISVHPVVLSMVAVLGLDCKPEDVAFPNLEAKSKHYLERMGLFRLLGVESGIKITEHEPSGRFIPLTQIKEVGTLEAFIEDVIPLLHLKPQQAQPIRYILSELTRNVFEHSQSKTGAILCAQYYEKSHTIRLGIVDRGIGIKQTISNAYPAQNDTDAIKLALSPGITGTTRRIGGTAQNVGAGLFFIKSIAKTNRDFFMIYSGNGIYKLLKTGLKQKVRLYADPLRDKHSESNNLPYWQGTAIGVDMNLDSPEEFNDLLSIVYDVFQKTIKARRKEYYQKKARFI